MFSLSTNHTYDKGASGIAATLRFWGSMPEDVVTTGLWKGESDYGHIPLQTVNGVTIAYLSYTEPVSYTHLSLFSAVSESSCTNSVPFPSP